MVNERSFKPLRLVRFQPGVLDNQLKGWYSKFAVETCAGGHLPGNVREITAVRIHLAVRMPGYPGHAGSNPAYDICFRNSIGRVPGSYPESCRIVACREHYEEIAKAQNGNLPLVFSQSPRE